MTDKLAVARILREIGLYLDLKGDNRFRARAYETGARAVEELREELPLLVAQQRLTESRGIGPALASVIAEIVTTGGSQQLEKLRGELPPGVLELAQVPGLTIKKIEQLHAALGIDSVETLRAACTSGQVRTIKGFGAKTEEKLLQALERWERRDARVLLVDALEAAEPLVAYLARHPAALNVELAGSLRRWRETAADVDIVVASEDAAAIVEHFVAYPYHPAGRIKFF